MSTLFLLIPWVLTVGILLFIIIRNKQQEVQNEDLLDMNEEIVRVAQYENKAYWVHDNIFYEADLIKEPDFSTAKPIDTMSMSPRQLKELLTILDELENYGKD